MNIFRRKDYDKELTGTPGQFLTIEDGIKDQELRIQARHDVWLATLGQLNPEDVEYPMMGFSIGAMGELKTLASMTFGKEDPSKPFTIDIRRDFTLLQFFI